MDDMIFYIVIGIAVCGGIFKSVMISRQRHKKNYREHIEPILKKQGLQFISSEYPGIFKTGPFDKIEVSFGTPQTRAGGIRGEYSEYRIVTFQDKTGKEYKIWAKLEFEAFQLKQLRWRIETSTIIPKEIEAIIEK